MSIPVGSGYRGPDGRLGYLLRQAYQSMRSEIDAVARRHGITAPQFSVMSVLEHEPGLSGADVARQSMLRAQTAHEIILILERDGLVERSANPADKRRHLVHLTPRGHQVLDHVNPEVAAVEDRVLAALSPEGRDGLVEGLVFCALTYRPEPE